MMEGTPLLSLPQGMLVDQIQITETGLAITVIATHPASCCPLCSEVSSSLHSHYQRTLSDVPCGGRKVRLCLTVRRFYCHNTLCERKVFTERMPQFVEPWARMTIRLCEALQSIGLATCGKGGTRLAARLGMQTSRNTILRRIMELPDPTTRSVVFLGIDDFSFRRGYRFGTILVNLESHRVVDLLPDRQAETAAQWMRQQPDVAVVSRDRGSEYASAAREGAPQAIQCADRFHVVKNLTEAVQVLLARCQAEILAEKKRDEPCQQEQNKPIISLEEWRPPEPARARESPIGPSSWPICTVSTGGGVAATRDEATRQCTTTWPQ
jgi:transposase